MLFTTHTYPVFCKLIETRAENEQLTQKLYEMYKRIITPQVNFYEMSRNEILNHQEKIQNELNEEIKIIFNNNIRIIIQEENTIRLTQITSNNYIYVFTYDCKKNIAVLVDFYPLPSTSSTRTTKLLKSRYKCYLNNKTYYLTNTYNAFCSYARYIQKPINRNLNESFFQSAKTEIANNNTNNIKQFSYMIVGEHIILYAFN